MPRVEVRAQQVVGVACQILFVGSVVLLLVVSVDHFQALQTPYAFPQRPNIL